MFKVLSMFFVGCFVASSYGSPAASFIKPCKPGDDACILSSAQAAISHFADGIPDLGVVPMDPLVLNDVKSNEGDLQLQFKNLNVAGPRKCKFTRATMKPDASHLEFDVDCPITATGQYKADGKILFVPIEGEGPMEIKTERILITFKVKLEHVDGADGKKHWHISDYSYDYTPQEQVHYKLDNLFNGDKEKAEPVLTILNHSWKEVLLTIGKPIIKEIVNKAKDNIETFLKGVPADELYLA